MTVENNYPYAYPDVMESCDPHESHQLRRSLLIVKVLSLATKAHGWGLKFSQYNRLPNLCHHILIWSHAALAEANDIISLADI